MRRCSEGGAYFPYGHSIVYSSVRAVCAAAAVGGLLSRGTAAVRGRAVRYALGVVGLYACLQAPCVPLR